MTSGRKRLCRPIGRDPAVRQHDHPIGKPRGQPKIVQAHHHAGAALRPRRAAPSWRRAHRPDRGWPPARRPAGSSASVASVRASSSRARSPLRQGIDGAVGERQPVDAPQRALDGVGIPAPRAAGRGRRHAAGGPAPRGRVPAAASRPTRLAADRRCAGRERRCQGCAIGCAVELDLAAGGAVEPGEMAQQGRLARSVGADDGRDLAGGKGDVDGLEHRARRRGGRPGRGRRAWLMRQATPRASGGSRAPGTARRPAR